MNKLPAGIKAVEFAYDRERIAKPKKSRFAL